MSLTPLPAQYFPVEAKPLRMKAGLLPFGTDFGNGSADALYFQRDVLAETYADAKALVSSERHQLLDVPHANSGNDVVLQWMERQLRHEHGISLEGVPAATVKDRMARLAAVLQEDFAVVHRTLGAIAVHVCFPSGWRPERLAGASFAQIHGPVPGFADERIGQSMTEAMIERGPFVRFVWTVSADDALDHHPDGTGRRPWTEQTSRGWLRVERQLTVPFREAQCGLFLIRTHLYAFESLTPAQRVTLHEALQALPDEIAHYKGLYEGRAHIQRVLAASRDAATQEGEANETGRTVGRLL
jgi:dimethylamine monooxygenase subunit A